MRKRVLFPLVFLLTTGAAFGYSWWTTDSTDTLTGVTQNPGQTVTKFFSQLTHPEQPLSASFDGKSQISVLMLGLDHVPESRRDPNPLRRGDSDILATVDFDTRQVRMLSIPRDGWVEQANSRGEIVHDKLAHAYAHGMEREKDNEAGGVLNSADAIGRLVGITPQYYVVIQFDGLAKLVDALGGLDVDVEKRMKYTDRAGGLYIDFKPGPQHMTGEQVVQYARFRHDAVGDIGRMGRQQKVIKLIMEKVKQPENLARLPALARILQGAVLTNFSPDQLVAFVNHIKDFETAGIQSQTLMSYGNQEKGHRGDAPGAGRMSVQIIYPPDIEVGRKFLQDLSVPVLPTPGAEGATENAAGSPAADSPATGADTQDKSATDDTGQG